MLNIKIYSILFILLLHPIDTQQQVLSTENTQLMNEPFTDLEMVSLISEDVSDEVISSNEALEGNVSDELDEVSEAFKDKTILIDAGHGGHDVGAIGASESYEKDITYTTASELKRTLTVLGANAIVTRINDDFISLKARTAYSNTVDVDVFLSLHYNSFPEQPDVSGIETYYYHDQHKELAQFIQQGLIKKTNARDRSVSKGDYLVLRENFKPSALLELGFISNQESEDLLQTNFYQKKIVAGIIHGLKEYFSNQKAWEG